MSKIYCGKGKEISGKFGTFYKVSICLDDIPVEHLYKAKNGKRYATLNMSEMKQADEKGNTHTVIVDTWKPSTPSTPPNTPPENFVDDSSEILF